MQTRRIFVVVILMIFFFASLFFLVIIFYLVESMDVFVSSVKIMERIERLAVAQDKETR